MGKGAKKASKLVKPEKQEKTKTFDKDEEPPVSHPPPPSVPSPIPEEPENGYLAQGSVHRDDRPLNPATFPNDHWSVGGDPPGAWRASSASSHVASPRLEEYRDFPDSGVQDSRSQALSWGERSSSPVSSDQRRKYYRSSPHPGTAADLGSDLGDVPGSNDEIKLDYINEEASGMSPSYSTDHHWDATSQTQPNPPQTRPSQQSGPAFGIYATSFSNPPIAPHPLPAAPNVVSKASDAAARLDKTKRPDIPVPPQPQPQYVPPSGPAGWHSWIKPGVYKPSVEEAPPPPPPAPHVPPPPVTTSSGMPPSVLKASSSHLPRGVWEARNDKGASMNAWGQQPKPTAQGATAWAQHRPSADGWPGYQAKGGYDGLNDGGWNQPNNGGLNQPNGGWSLPNNGGLNQPNGGWSQPNNGGLNQPNGGWSQPNNGAWNQPNNDGWYGGDKKGHGRSKSAGAWGGKRNVQWEQEQDDDESDETDDDSWGEEDDEGEDNGGWVPVNKKGNGWVNTEGGTSGMRLSKQDNGWAGSAPIAWDQGGLNPGAGDWGGQPGWGEERKSQHQEPSGAAAMKDTMSPQQRAQILNSLLNVAGQKQAGHGMQPLQQSEHISKKIKQEKENKRQTQYSTGWGLEDDSWGNSRGDSGNGKGNGHGTRSPSSKGASTAWDAWGGAQDASRYSMPSLTLSYAYKDSKTRLDPGSQSKINDVAKIRFHESKGAALHPVHAALFNLGRLARDRIHWSFPPDKDERVRAALSWTQEMSYGLGTLALHKFLQHRERGALIINADYSPPDKPKEFAVDYLTFYDLQKSFDKTLQSSVISYDPTLQVIVFVFLPSKSGNSVAIWRRKLIVPNNARLRFQSELDIALSGLKEPKDYEVFVDEVPKKKKDLPDAPKAPISSEETKPKKKRKWWQFFKSKS